MPLKAEDLAQFYGTEEYTRWSPLFRNVVLTDGAKYVAENGGGQGAYWLMDAIASHQPTILKNPACRDFQLWTLKVNADRSAVLTGAPDSDVKPTIVQKIEYTDFDLPEISFYCNPLDERTRCILLRSEY